MERRAKDEGGFTMVELMAAVSMLAVGFLSLAGAMGLGLRQIGLARQRQSAAEIANGRLEHLRNVPYDAVALNTQPAHNTDPDDPDYDVSTSGETYDVPGPAAAETLIVSSSTGQVLHFEDPVTVGATEMKVYQYVTWVDDPNISGTQNYKRVAIAVLFKFPSINGVARVVRASALVTTQKVIVAGSGSAPQVGSPSPTPSPTPTPTPSPTPCAGDVTAPTGDFAVQSGTGSETGYTTSTSVTLTASLTDTCSPVTGKFSNDNSTWGVDTALPVSPTSVTWTVSSGDGSKSIWGRFWDAVSNTKTTGPYVIVLDTTKPTTPGTLTYTKSCQGNNRTVNLSWGASTDTNFRGYRVYKSINNGAWTAVGTVSTTTMSHTDLKTYDSIRYDVVGYDKAGNQSNVSNIITLSKNAC